MPKKSNSKTVRPVVVKESTRFVNKGQGSMSLKDMKKKSDQTIESEFAFKPGKVK